MVQFLHDVNLMVASTMEAISELFGSIYLSLRVFLANTFDYDSDCARTYYLK